MVISASFYSMSAQSTTALPTTLNYESTTEGTAVEFCVARVLPTDEYAVFIDETDVTSSIASLVETGAASLITAEDGMCIRVENAGFSQEQTVSIWLGDQMGTWQVSELMPNYDYSSIIDFNLQIPIAYGDRQVMAIKLKAAGDRCLLYDDDAPAIYGGRCGGHVSKGNPFPCCDNNANGDPMDKDKDGNCIWWAARAANLSWGFFPDWGGATQWRANAGKDSRVTVGTFHPNVQGIYIASKNNHVAWATGNTKSNGTVEVEEMNCGHVHIYGTMKKIRREN